tara:strand:- start:279 stop:929 length:651 start_codon:yes stop_codon:yes gene_type:complete
MQDSFRYKGMRKRLIKELRELGITDDKVLNAFDVIPRHYFLDNAFAEQAYANIPFQIGSGQTISQPYTVAFQTQLLELKKGEKVLEIGTGSGFQTAVLAELGGKIYSIERHRELHLKASTILQHLNYNVRLSFGDGFKGLSIFAPFDKILITCGAPFIPEELLKQLNIGGIMIIPVGEGSKQVMQKITKLSDEDFETKEFGHFSFVPMLEKKVNKS